jgi:hypothetical protein
VTSAALASLSLPLQQLETVHLIALHVASVFNY